MRLEPGAELTITTRETPGSGDTVSTTYLNLATDVEKGCRILIDDGNIELVVTEVFPKGFGPVWSWAGCSSRTKG